MGLNNNLDENDDDETKMNVTSKPDVNGHVYAKSENIYDLQSRNDDDNVNHLNSINNNVLVTSDESKKKFRLSSDKSYFIAKEILMTERTYKKDLDVINVWWRNEVGVEEFGDAAELLLALIAPLTTIHAQLAKELETCLQTWDAHTSIDDQLALGNILVNTLPNILPLYEEYLDGHTDVLQQLDVALKTNVKFEMSHRDFETQKVSYLPFTTFILKPVYRLLHYQNLLDRLLKYYTETHLDRAGCVSARAALSPILMPALETLKHSENIATLHELQRDIIGFDLTANAGHRQFIRHGCLLKYSKRGFQPRMFFLFSDILLYTSRQVSTAQFRVHGHMPLRGVMIDLPEKPPAPHSFIIYGGNRALTVSASTETDKEKWLSDFHWTLQRARDHVDANLTYLSLKSCCSSDEILEQHDPAVTSTAVITTPSSDDQSSPSSPSDTNRMKHTRTNQTSTSSLTNTLQHPRNNTIVQVCWHRSTTIGMEDLLNVAQNQLSGYLLRKFKNSNGWQKLWVVFTSFCLFFYKSSADEFPLASLPLLGYTVGVPSASDNIHKDFVFKLQFKNHVYFFRAESQYTFERWMEVMKSATESVANKSFDGNGVDL